MSDKKPLPGFALNPDPNEVARFTAKAEDLSWWERVKLEVSMALAWGPPNSQDDYERVMTWHAVHGGWVTVAYDPADVTDGDDRVTLVVTYADGHTETRVVAAGWFGVVHEAQKGG